jgi:hypothetical protein
MMCLYSCLNYSVCNLLLFYTVLYCHLWPVWLYSIFPHYLINGTIFGKKIIEQNLCAAFFLGTNSTEIFSVL